MTRQRAQGMTVILKLGRHGDSGITHVVNDFDTSNSNCGVSIDEQMGEFPFDAGSLNQQRANVPGKLCGTCGRGHFLPDWNERVAKELARRANLSPTIAITFCRNQSGSSKVVHVLLPNRDDDLTMCSLWSGEELGTHFYPRGPLAPRVSTNPLRAAV